MNIIGKLTDVLTIVAIILVVAIIIGVGGYFIYIKFIAPKRRQMRLAKKSRVDYTDIKKKNSLDYVKFDRIESATDSEGKEFGMVVSGNGLTYTVMMELMGFDYMMASAAEQDAVICFILSLRKDRGDHALLIPVKGSERDDARSVAKKLLCVLSRAPQKRGVISALREVLQAGMRRAKDLVRDLLPFGKKLPFQLQLAFCGLIDDR